MYTSLHGTYALFLSEFNENLTLEKHTNVKFHKNTLTGSRVVLCGRTDGQAEITKLIVTSYNFANSLKNEYVYSTEISVLLTDILTCLNGTLFRFK